MNDIKLILGIGRKEINITTKEVVNGVNRECRAYTVWKGILRRCYCPKSLQKYPTYLGCTVCEEWLYFSNFKKWFYENYKEGFQVDKDFLCEGVKLYSPETCIFIPQWLNSFTTDVKRNKGLYPTGVSKHKYGFQSRIVIKGKQVTLGYFDNPEEAHDLWLSKKLELIEEMKPEVDCIDERIYPSLIKRYSKT